MDQGEEMTPGEEMTRLVGPDGYWAIGLREDECNVVEWWTPALAIPSYTQGDHLTAADAYAEALSRLRDLVGRAS